MLVLRRRAQEAIVFEGGLLVTLVDVVDHRAWLAFESPTIPIPVVVSALSVTADMACIGIRSPASQSRSGDATTVALTKDLAGGPGSSILLVNNSLGDRIVFDGLVLEIASLEQGRAVLSATVAELGAAVGVSVFSVSSAEVKIGIDAPNDVRVYREEVWLAMRSANQGAAAWSSTDLDSLTGGTVTPVEPVATRPEGS